MQLSVRCRLLHAVFCLFSFVLVHCNCVLTILWRCRALERKRVQIEKQRAENAQLQRALDVKESMLITDKLGALLLFLLFFSLFGDGQYNIGCFRANTLGFKVRFAKQLFLSLYDEWLSDS